MAKVTNLFPCGNDELELSSFSERERVKGVISSSENIELFEDDAVTEFCIEISPEIYDRIKHLDCFVPLSKNGRKAITSKVISFSNRHREDIELLLVIHDGCEFRINSMVMKYTGKMTNEIVQDFATTFRSDIFATFDPFAENHKSPTLRVKIW